MLPSTIYSCTSLVPRPILYWRCCLVFPRSSVRYCVAPTTTGPANSGCVNGLCRCRAAAVTACGRRALVDLLAVAVLSALATSERKRLLANERQSGLCLASLSSSPSSAAAVVLPVAAALADSSAAADGIPRSLARAGDRASRKRLAIGHCHCWKERKGQRVVPTGQRGWALRCCLYYPACCVSWLRVAPAHSLTCTDSLACSPNASDRRPPVLLPCLCFNYYCYRGQCAIGRNEGGCLWTATGTVLP